MATFAVGDIHGNRLALVELLASIRLEATKDDTVVFLGDYIDRGPDAKGCIDAILAFGAEHPGQTIALRGNHEDWLLQTMRSFEAHSWLLGMNGLDTIRSYSVEAAQALADAIGTRGSALYTAHAPLPYHLFFDAMPAAHVRFFENLKVMHTDEWGIYVHAGVDPTASLSEQTSQGIVWGWHEGRFPEDYAGERTVVYGHRNNPVLDEQGWPHPRVTGATIGLDTSHHGVASAVRLPDGGIIQSARHQQPPA